MLNLNAQNPSITLIKASAVQLLPSGALAIVQVSVGPGYNQSPTDQAPRPGRMRLTYSGVVAGDMQQRQGLLLSQHYSSKSLDPDSYAASRILLLKVRLLL